MTTHNDPNVANAVNVDTWHTITHASIARLDVVLSGLYGCPVALTDLADSLRALCPRASVAVSGSRGGPDQWAYTTPPRVVSCDIVLGGSLALRQAAYTAGITQRLAADIRGRISEALRIGTPHVSPTAPPNYLAAVGYGALDHVTAITVALPTPGHMGPYAARLYRAGVARTLAHAAPNAAVTVVDTTAGRRAATVSGLLVAGATLDDYDAANDVLGRLLHDLVAAAYDDGPDPDTTARYLRASYPDYDPDHGHGLRGRYPRQGDYGQGSTGYHAYTAAVAAYFGYPVAPGVAPADISGNDGGPTDYGATGVATAGQLDYPDRHSYPAGPHGEPYYNAAVRAWHIAMLAGTRPAYPAATRWAAPQPPATDSNDDDGPLGEPGPLDTNPDTGRPYGQGGAS